MIQLPRTYADPSRYFNRGNKHLYFKRYAQAEKDFLACLQLDSNNDKAKLAVVKVQKVLYGKSSYAQALVRATSATSDNVTATGATMTPVIASSPPVPSSAGGISIDSASSLNERRLPDPTSVSDTNVFAQVQEALQQVQELQRQIAGGLGDGPNMSDPNQAGEAHMSDPNHYDLHRDRRYSGESGSLANYGGEGDRRSQRAYQHEVRGSEDRHSREYQRHSPERNAYQRRNSDEGGRQRTCVGDGNWGGGGGLGHINRGDYGDGPSGRERERRYSGARDQEQRERGLRTRGRPDSGYERLPHGDGRIDSRAGSMNAPRSRGSNGPDRTYVSGRREPDEGGRRHAPGDPNERWEGHTRDRTAYLGRGKGAPGYDDRHSKTAHWSARDSGGGHTYGDSRVGVARRGGDRGFERRHRMDQPHAAPPVHDRRPHLDVPLD